MFSHTDIRANAVLDEIYQLYYDKKYAEIAKYKLKNFIATDDSKKNFRDFDKTAPEILLYFSALFKASLKDSLEASLTDKIYSYASYLIDNDSDFKPIAILIKRIVKIESSRHKEAAPWDFDAEDLFERWKDHTNSSSLECFLEIVWCAIYQNSDMDDSTPCRRNQHSQILANKISSEKNHQLTFILDSLKIHGLIFNLPYGSDRVTEWIDKLQEMSNQGNIFSHEIMSWLILLSYRINFNDIKKNLAGINGESVLLRIKNQTQILDEISIRYQLKDSLYFLNKINNRKIKNIINHFKKIISQHYSNYSNSLKLNEESTKEVTIQEYQSHAQSNIHYFLTAEEPKEMAVMSAIFNVPYILNGDILEHFFKSAEAGHYSAQTALGRHILEKTLPRQYFNEIFSWCKMDQRGQRVASRLASILEDYDDGKKDNCFDVQTGVSLILKATRFDKNLKEQFYNKFKIILTRLRDGSKISPNEYRKSGYFSISLSAEQCELPGKNINFFKKSPLSQNDFEKGNKNVNEYRKSGYFSISLSAEQCELPGKNIHFFKRPTASRSDGAKVNKNISEFSVNYADITAEEMASSSFGNSQSRMK